MKRIISLVLGICIYISMILVSSGQVAFVFRSQPPQLLQDHLVLSWDFSEGWNQQVFNRKGSAVYQSPLNYLGAHSEQFDQGTSLSSKPWTATGATVTDFYTGTTDPNGNHSASRIVMTGGSSQVLFFTLPLSAVQYCFSLYVKSNTGSSQAIRMGNASSPGSDQTVTTSWTRLSQAFTPSAGNILVGFLNDAAHDALDISIYGAKLELGSTPTTYVRSSTDIQLGIQAVADAADPAWSTQGLTYGPGLYAHAIADTPISFNEISVYALLKKMPSTDSPDFFEPILTSEASTYSLVMETRDTLNSGISANSVGPCFGFGFTPNIVNASGVKVDDGAWHVFTGVYDGSEIDLYWDGTLVAQKTTGPLSSITVNRLYSGIFENVNSTTDYYPGMLGGLHIYDQGHGSSTVRAQVTNLFGRMACRGVVMPQMRSIVVPAGDSITAGLGITQAQRWSWLLLQSISPTVNQYNEAVGGSQTADAAARMGLIASIFGNPSLTTKIIVADLGANDLIGKSAAQFIIDMKALIAQYRAAGATKILVVPVLPRQDAAGIAAGFNAKKDTVNAAYLSDASFSNGTVADGVVTLSSTILDNNAPNDSSLFQTDKVHPTAFSNLTYLYPGIRTSVVPLLP